MLQILYKPSFVRQYKKLSEELQEDAKNAMERFKANPHDPALRIHKLKGRLKSYQSFSVNYRFRIVFEWVSKKQVRFLMIGDHTVYR